MSLFEELKRRNVFKVGIAYIILAWVVMQVADVILNNIVAPDWVFHVLLLFLAIGFPFAVFFAWAFEMTPEGIKREREVNRSQSITSQTGKKLNLAITTVLVLAISYLLYDKFVAQKPDITTVPAAETAVTGSAAIPAAAKNRQSIAVLPFENRSALKEDEFFVDGIHDDLLTTIAKIGSLKVISRTSVMEYRDTRKKIPVIAKELGVANILEGGIQRSGNQVRINVQLIDAVSDEHLWAEIFDRELTAGNLFAIQSEISQKIADALEMVLSVEEKTRINTMPTESLEAYDAYLRGRQLMATRKADRLQQAVEKFAEAVEIDPQFALAWVNLADVNYLLSSYGLVPWEVTMPVLEEAVAHALDIDKQLGEAYVSLAHIHEYYQRQGEAEAAYRRAIELSPNYATAYHWFSNFVFGISRLRTAEALDLAQKAFELDPRSSIIRLNLARHYEYKGLNSLAERQLLDLIELDPGFANAYSGLADLYLTGTGQFDLALEYSRKSAQLNPGNPFVFMTQIDIYQQLGDVRAMEIIRSRIAEVTGEDFWLVGYVDVAINLTKNNPAGTQEAIDWLLPRIKETYTQKIMAATELVLGKKVRARELFLEANPGWLDPDQWQGLIQHNPRFPCIFSWILINTGDEILGTDLLRQTTAFLDEALPVAVEHVDAWSPEICYLTSGDIEKALLSLETQLAHGHLYWRNLYYRLPMYDSIRFEPRFLAVIEGSERIIAAQREAVAQMDAAQTP